MKSISIMEIPCGFKIRKKVDVECFTNKCMKNDNTYIVKINKDLAIFLEKEKDGTISVLEKRWDLYNPFNPLLEVANTKNDCYKYSVYDYIWKYRKYINAEWFNN